MEKETNIVEYLRNTYKPSAILLHGSRAVDKNRSHSDWDTIMFFHGEIPKRGHRERIDGEDVEWKAFQLPVSEEKFIETFGTYLQFAKVLWEEEEAGSKILKKAAKLYSKGPNLSKNEIESEKLFFEHKLFGMKDDMDTPYMFLRHLSILFNRANNMWFEIIHNEFSKPFYMSVPHIKEKDPEYYEHLITLCSDGSSNERKIASAEWIYKKLFKD